MSTKARKGITHERRILGFQKKNSRDIVNSLRVDTGDGRLQSFGNAGSESESGGSPGINPSVPKLHELGKFSGAREIDFKVYDDRTLFGSIDDDTQITFKNFPTLLFLTMRLQIKSVDPIITIGGNIVAGAGSNPPVTTEVNEFIDVTVGSDDQGETIFIGSIKKNDQGQESPGLPENVETSNHSDTSVTLSWEPPLIGGLPITYDVLYSESPAETDGVPDSPIEDEDTLDLTDLSVTINGLTAATTYYFWVRAKNESGNSEYVGSIQTNLDGTYNAGDVGFDLTPLDFNTIQAEWTQPAGKQLKFTLKRDLGGGITETVVDNDVPASEATETYDDNFLDPDTEYDYIFEVRNEFGTLISTINASETTDPLPTPTVVFEAVGTRLKFTVTLPADINIAEIEYSLSDSVDGSGAFVTTVEKRQITRGVGVTGETDVEYTSPIRTKSTVYYGHAKLRKNSGDGPWSITDNDTTSDVSPPSQPDIDVTSPDTGQVRIKLDFNDAESTGERIVVQYRISSSVGPYDLLGSFERDNPPSDDLDADEDEIEVIRSGFTPGETFTFRAEAENQSGPNAGGPDFDNVLVDS